MFRVHQRRSASSQTPLAPGFGAEESGQTQHNGRTLVLELITISEGFKGLYDTSPKSEQPVSQASRLLPQRIHPLKGNPYLLKAAARGVPFCRPSHIYPVLTCDVV
jgi:hypothetical protein